MDVMHKQFIALPLLLLSAHCAVAATLTPPAPLIGTAPGIQKTQLLDAAQQCIKSTLKNKEFAISTPGFFGMGAKDGTAQGTSLDPSAMVDINTSAGSVEARHHLVVKAMMSGLVYRGDLTIEAKDEKFRMSWHDIQSAVETEGWQEDLRPANTTDPGSQKATEMLNNTLSQLSICMLKPRNNDNW